MDKMTLLINDHVAIVSILDLQNVADKRVCSKRISEIVHSTFILLLHLASQKNILTFTWISEVLPEVITEVALLVKLTGHGLADVINSKTIFNELNQSSVMASGNNLIGF